MTTIRDSHGAGAVSFRRRGKRAHLYMYSSPTPLVLEEPSFESCMLDARLLAKQRDLTLPDCSLLASASRLTPRGKGMLDEEHEMIPSQGTKTE